MRVTAAVPMARRAAASADPEEAVDRLPQPYRMIDKVVAAIVDGAERTALQRAAQRALEAAGVPDMVGGKAGLGMETRSWASSGIFALGRGGTGWLPRHPPQELRPQRQLQLSDGGAAQQAVEATFVSGGAPSLRPPSARSLPPLQPANHHTLLRARCWSGSSVTLCMSDSSALRRQAVRHHQRQHRGGLPAGGVGPGGRGPAAVATPAARRARAAHLLGEHRPPSPGMPSFTWPATQRSRLVRAPAGSNRPCP
jgi:hypothetical protein